MPQTHLILLWHMHQPFYKDLAEGVYTMPWVRLHALKDYYGMVAMLRDFPSVRVTFNLVPSLIVQVEEYAHDVAREPAYETAFKPVDALTLEERENLLGSVFQLNRENLLRRYPRFRELFEKAESTGYPLAARLFPAQDLLDLQVLSQLAWFDEMWLARDADLRRLAAKERGYSEEDKSILRRKEVELFKVILEEYREASRRGQIEVSTSPFYHPILPLLCDTNVGRESHPAIELPRRPFRHPEDARDQLRASVELHTRLFGQRPRGLWPSEGSVSDEVLRLAIDEGFEWAATDEGVLARTLGIEFYRDGAGIVTNGRELYRPYAFGDGDRKLALYFRDHHLSDLIGFVYSRMDPDAAAADLHERIRAAGRSTGERPAVVSVILDGENAWEYYRGNGREFLKSFYGRVASDPEVRAVTASEAMAVTGPAKLSHVVPGSWINANFNIWIGAEEDNRAWALLANARDFFAEQFGKAEVPEEQKKVAQQELWIAEGSDWCWWYGPEHSSAHDEEFDLLYRKHLSNIYSKLGASPPDELAVPIKRPRVQAVNMPPLTEIEPRVDGEVTSYFEWLGAGVYVPDYRSGSMHGGARCVEALYYGLNGRALYLRLDLNETFLKVQTQFEVRINVGSQRLARLHATMQKGQPPELQFWKGDQLAPVSPAGGEELQVAFGRIFEVALGRALLGLGPKESTEVQVSLWINELPVQVIPQEGWLPIELREDLISW